MKHSQELITIIEAALILLDQDKTEDAKKILKSAIEQHSNSVPELKLSKKRRSSKPKTKDTKQLAQSSPNTPKSPRESINSSRRESRSKTPRSEVVESPKEPETPKTPAEPIKQVATIENAEQKERNPNERTEKQEKAWKNILNELYTTERDFIRDLRIILDVFKTPMESNELITAEESALIFSNIPTILQVNAEIFRQLQSINSENSEKIEKKKKKKGMKKKKKKKKKKNGMDEELDKITGQIKVTIKMPETEIDKVFNITGLTSFRDIRDKLIQKLIQFNPSLEYDDYQFFHSSGFFQIFSFISMLCF